MLDQEIKSNNAYLFDRIEYLIDKIMIADLDSKANECLDKAIVNLRYAKQLIENGLRI